MARHPEPDEDARNESISQAENASMREVELDTIVTRRTPTRTRLIQVGMFLTVLFVVGGLMFRGYRAAQPQSQPTTVAAADDFSMNVAIYTNVNYSTLTVNGKKLDANPPVIVTLHQGANSITVSALPFQSHTCTFEMPLRSIEGAQCVGGGFGDPRTIGGKKASTGVLVPLTLADLPAEQQHGVVAVVAQAIDDVVFHTTVLARQYIPSGVDGQGHIVSHLTEVQLQADVSFVRQTGQASQQDQSCIEDICAPVIWSPGPSIAAGKIWILAASVASQWRFRAQTGAIVATSPKSDSFSNEIDVALQYDAAQGWRPSGQPTAGGVTSALDVMANAECNAGMVALFTYAVPGAGTGLSTRANGIEGCELQVLNSSGKPTASYIWRFGVLLAADAAGHKLVPSLPAAPQAEIDAMSNQA